MWSQRRLNNGPAGAGGVLFPHTFPEQVASVLFYLSVLRVIAGTQQIWVNEHDPHSCSVFLPGGRVWDHPWGDTPSQGGWVEVAMTEQGPRPR